MCNELDVTYRKGENFLVEFFVEIGSLGSYFQSQFNQIEINNGPYVKWTTKKLLKYDPL